MVEIKEKLERGGGGGSGAREAQGGGLGASSKPIGRGAHPTVVPPSPSKPIRGPRQAGPSPSEARQVAPIRAPSRPAPVRRHLAPCHELNQLTTVCK